MYKNKHLSFNDRLIIESQLSLGKSLNILLN